MAVGLSGGRWTSTGSSGTTKKKNILREAYETAKRAGKPSVGEFFGGQGILKLYKRLKTAAVEPKRQAEDVQGMQQRAAEKSALEQNMATPDQIIAAKKEELASAPRQMQKIGDDRIRTSANSDKPAWLVTQGGQQRQLTQAEFNALNQFNVSQGAITPNVTALETMPGRAPGLPGSIAQYLQEKLATNTELQRLSAPELVEALKTIQDIPGEMPMAPLQLGGGGVGDALNQNKSLLGGLASGRPQGIIRGLLNTIGSVDEASIQRAEAAGENKKLAIDNIKSTISNANAGDYKDNPMGAAQEFRKQVDVLRQTQAVLKRESAAQVGTELEGTIKELYEINDFFETDIIGYQIALQEALVSPDPNKIVYSQQATQEAS